MSPRERGPLEARMLEALQARRDVFRELVNLARRVDQLSTARELDDERIRRAHARIDELLLRGRLELELEEGPDPDLLTVAAGLVAIHQDLRELQRQVSAIVDRRELLD